MDLLPENSVPINISIEKARNFTLKKHFLLEKSTKGNELNVIEQIMGLNGQGSLNFNISLWNRSKKLRNNFIDDALFNEKKLVRTYLMRGTVHIVSSNNLYKYYNALKNSLLEDWNKPLIKRGFKKNESDWDIYFNQIIEALSETPLSKSEIKNLLNLPTEAPPQLVNLIIYEMSRKGLICHAYSNGPWYHHLKHYFSLRDGWLPYPQKKIGENEAKKWLLENYLNGYGPASIQDFCYWTGLKSREAKPIFQALNEKITLVKINNQKSDYFILNKDLPVLNNIQPIENHVNLLPSYDSLIMGHKVKNRFGDKKVMKKVFLPLARVESVILLDGMIKGTWNLKKKGKKWVLTFELFSDLSPKLKNMLSEKAYELEDFTEFDVDIEWDLTKHVSNG